MFLRGTESMVYMDSKKMLLSGTESMVCMDSKKMLLRGTEFTARLVGLNLATVHRLQVSVPAVSCVYMQLQAAHH